MASQRGTGGVLDCGTVEEDGPVTWETPDRPVVEMPKCIETTFPNG